MYLKLFTQILDSSIADDRRLRHFFTDFMLCADLNGIVMMTESAIARRIGATIEEVRWGIAELEKPDPMSKTTDNEGRRIERMEGHGYGWRVINFEMYHAMKTAEEMREKTRIRVQNHRAARKAAEDQRNTDDVTPCNAGNECNPTKTHTNTDTQTNTNRRIRRPKKKICPLTQTRLIFSLKLKPLPRKGPQENIRPNSLSFGKCFRLWLAQEAPRQISALSISKRQTNPLTPIWCAVWLHGLGVMSGQKIMGSLLPVLTCFSKIGNGRASQ